ncbi:hypothetical protein ACET3Z_010570 [Daucus carota]
MAGEFEIAETNYCANLNPGDCSDRFKKWIRFLTQQSLVSIALTADIPIQVQPLYDFYSNAVDSTTLENYKLIGDLPNGRRIVITVDDVNRILGFPRDNFQVEPTTYNHRINFGKILLKEIIRKMGSVTQRSIHDNEKVECHYPRFLMLFLNDKMNDGDRSILMLPFSLFKSLNLSNSISINKINNNNTSNRLNKTCKNHNNNHLNKTSNHYNLSKTTNPLANPRITLPITLLTTHQSSYNSPHQSQNQSPPHYNFFPDQQASIFPSQSEPIPSPTHTHNIPQPQSTSQPLPADSAINPELQDFRTDLQVAQVLSNLTDTFIIDIADFDCDIGFDFQTPSNEPENTPVHNQADISISITDSSSNTSTNTTTTPVLREPAALSHKKQRVAEPETTAAASISSQKDLDTEMVNIQSLDSFSPQNAFIEIGRPIAVSCKESSTQLALTLVNTEPLSYDSSLRESTDFQNMSYENFSDHSFFLDQDLLGNLQVHLPSQASEGQFVPSHPTVPSRNYGCLYRYW